MFTKTLIAGASYLTIADTVVTMSVLQPNQAGEDFKFVGNNGMLYTATGQTSLNNNPSEDDVKIEATDVDFIERTSTVRTEEILPGFFGRLVEKVRENPVKTTLTLGAAAGVGAYGTYNYRDHGSVLPAYSAGNDNRTLRDTAAAASAISSWFRR